MFELICGIAIGVIVGIFVYSWFLLKFSDDDDK